MSDACFISYKAPTPGEPATESDLSIAQELHERLGREGILAYFDKERLKPGFDWYAHLKEHADSARILLPVLTPRWKTSRWTKFETYAGEHIIPLIVEGTWEEISTPPLRGIQSLAIDFTSNTDAAWGKLVAAIREHLRDPAPERTPPGHDHIVYDHNPFFVGREDDLLRIHETLHPAPTPARTRAPAAVLFASGGFGKTTLAREYVDAFWRCYRQTFWVDCRLGVVAGMAAIYDILHPNSGGALKPDEKALMAFRKLHEDTSRLLVFDNADERDSDDPLERTEAALGAMHSPGKGERACDFIPSTGGCRVVITSRFGRWGLGKSVLTINELGEAPSRRLLLARRTAAPLSEPLPLAEDDAARALVEKLEGLPLALEQARAYMDANHTSVRAYLGLFKRAELEMLSRSTRGSTDYPHSVATTWNISVQKLSGPARVLLRLGSVLASTPIPLSLFQHDPAIIRTLASGQFPDAGPGSPSTDAELFVADLAHELDADTVLRRALAWVNDAFVGEPQDVQTWPVLDPLEPHASAVADSAYRAKIPVPTARLMSMLGALYHTKSKHVAAEPLMRRALAIDEASFGKDHLNVARDLHNLSQLLQATNRLAEAEPLMRRALAIDEASYGKDHTKVAIRLSNLAMLLQATNRLADTEPLMRRVVQIVLKFTVSSGHPHPYRQDALDNYAELLKAMGMSDAEIRRRIESLLDEYGMELGS